MDPLTAAFNALNSLIILSTKIWDATPAPLPEKEAENWAQFSLNIGNFFLKLQDKINAEIK